MEDLVDQGLGMEETVHSLLRRPSLKESYHSDSLLAPDTDFMTGRKTSDIKCKGTVHANSKESCFLTYLLWYAARMIVWFLFAHCNFCLTHNTMEINTV